MDVYIPTHLDIDMLSICMYLINDDFMLVMMVVVMTRSQVTIV